MSVRTEWGAHSADPGLAQLIAGCGLGDPHAMEALVDQTAVMVLRMCQMVVGDATGAEGCAVAAYRRVWREANSYDVHVASPRCWLATIAYLSARAY